MGRKLNARRRHRARGDALVQELGDEAVSRAADVRVLGTPVTEKVPDANLFQVDREGDATMVSARRVEQKGRVRRSEMAILSNEKVKPMRVGKFRKSNEGATEVRLLGRRNWKKRERKKIEGLKAYDLWAGQTMNSKVDKKGTVGGHGKAVLTPSSADSINPTFEAHQGRMGKAAEVILDGERRRRKWEMNLLTEADSGEMASKGNNTDKNANDNPELDEEADEEADGEADQIIKPATGERKTRTQRNKERRKKAMYSERLKSIKEKRRKVQYKYLAEILKQADEIEARRKKARSAGNREADASAPVHKRLAGARVPSETSVGYVSLSQDLGLTLREVVPPSKNALLSERFVSFQRRGFIIPTAASRKQAGRARKERIEEERRRGIRKVRPGRGSRSGLSFFRRRLGRK